MKDPFIRTYDAFDKNFCDGVIEVFGMNKKLGCTYKRNDGPKFDQQQELNASLINKSNFPDITESGWDEIDLRSEAMAPPFFDKLKECVKDYVNELQLKGCVSDTLWARNMLVQRWDSEKFQAYSAWHTEADCRDSSDRCLVYMLYLNDDFEGGNTQFKFSRHNEVPEAGKLVIWPAAFTHTHRGDMITEGVKYVVTGWVFF